MHVPTTFQGGVVLLLALAASSISASTGDSGGFFYGHISADSLPVKGAMVTFYHGQPVHSLSVFADEQGRFLSPDLPWRDGYRVRVRRAGWRDVLMENQSPAKAGQWLGVQMERIKDPAEMIQQLPSNYWMNLVLDEFDNQDHLLEFKMQCTYCHQQGSPLTSRRQFDRQQWVETIIDMGRRSAIISKSLREVLPEHYLAAYDEANVLAKLPAYDGDDGPLPVPSAAVRQAVIEEWNLGGPTSGQHDLMVYHPDGSIWTVDGPMDTLHVIRLDNNPDGERKSYQIPRGAHKPGGVYHKMDKGSRRGVTKGVEAYLAPHSLQIGANGFIWLTLASGNQLAGFDPTSETWDIVDVKEGINPHTLRFDKRGRLWYTLTATNHVGMFDPVSREQMSIRLTFPDFTTRLITWFTPFFLRNADILQLNDRAAEMDGVTMPMPYGIDIHPLDGSIWYSQLNMSHIGRIDPNTFAVTPIATPFVTPRRLRFDALGNLWVPSYAQGSIHLFDTEAMAWTKSYQIPVEPRGSEVPYAVFVDQETDDVWITGTQSDTIIRFAPGTERWTLYPLPTRVTYTRELDMDRAGNVWTSHSSSPAWHVEDGIPKVVRLNPTGAPDIATSGLFKGIAPRTGPAAAAATAVEPMGVR
ncbi:MAG: virginiamycin B lyase [Bacteroidia bacterium]|jgi:virginiamycin B lyase